MVLNDVLINLHDMDTGTTLCQWENPQQCDVQDHKIQSHTPDASSPTCNK